MTVINPSSISGITSITMPSGDGNVLTIHTNDGVERFRIDSSGNVKVGSACTISQDGDVFFTGVTTATTFTGAHSGSGANLTNLPAGNLTGALPAISGANLTGIAATDNVRTGILDVAGVSTFRNTMNVGAAVTISESGLEATGVGITVANINGGQIGGRRNIIINGDMGIAQRGTSSTSSGYQTVDRFQTAFDSGLTEAPTLSQVALTSSDTPYSLGFRHAFRITNGNQTSQDVNDYIHVATSLEAQDIASSGWNYTSTSGFITLSFWVKASTAQTMYVKVGDSDASRTFTFAFSATTSWTRIIKTIPGNSNLVFNNDNGVGLMITWVPYYGTSYTTSSHTNDAWNSDDGADQVPDMANTWFSANDATFDITGIQLEVGSQATAFEHRSTAEELKLCQRYCIKLDGFKHNARMNGSTNSDGYFTFPTSMRATPSFSSDVTAGKSMEYGSIGRTVANVYGGGSSPESAYGRFNISGSGTSGYASYNNLATGSYYLLDAEL